MPETTPLDVKCAECEAPPGTPCRTSYEDQTHQERQRLADLRSLDQGTCALCGQFMVKGSVLGSPVDAWHPDGTDAAACPNLPDPAEDWNGYALAVNLGATPGRPGLEHFRPYDTTPAP